MIAKVSIVILNYNGRGHLENFLPSVCASTYHDYEVVVADNASTDDSLVFLRANYPNVKLVLLKENLGYAGGYTEALKYVNAEYYVLLNSDVEVTPGWLEPIIELMDSDPKIGACQPKILSYTNRDHFEYAGAAGGWMDSLGYPFARGRVFDVLEEDRGQYDSTERIFWASGAAMFVRAPLFHQLKGFEPYFFAHMEEIDFCWRLQLLGYHVYACPKSVIYHLGGGTLPKGNERKVFLNFRNNMIMLAKCLPKRQWFWKIPFRIFLDVVSAWKSLLTGEAVYFFAIFEAHVAFVKWIFLNRKDSLFPIRRSSELSGWYYKCVAWDHFVKAKQTFAQIVQDKR